MSITKKMNVIGLVAAVLLIIGAVTPYATLVNLRTLEESTMTLAKDMGGVFPIICAVLIIVFSLFRLNVLTIIDGVLVSAYFAFISFALNSVVSEIKEWEEFTGMSYFHWMIGHWLFIAGLILVFVAGIYGLATKKKVKAAIEAEKTNTTVE